MIASFMPEPVDWRFFQWDRRVALVNAIGAYRAVDVAEFVDQWLTARKFNVVYWSAIETVELEAVEIVCRKHGVRFQYASPDSVSSDGKRGALFVLGPNHADNPGTCPNVLVLLSQPPSQPGYFHVILQQPYGGLYHSGVGDNIGGYEWEPTRGINSTGSVGLMLLGTAFGALLSYCWLA